MDVIISQNVSFSFLFYLFYGEVELKPKSRYTQWVYGWYRIVISK